ncbi:hypothetical protein EMIHUDRAFT_363440 [Emiliania huxleyi CCMP1516]|uniref:Uncharacterized protein n=2 Tax=Emiliania huxleyi TaxID=2903 RepID=A0A0D3J9D4_EMIH1|nr:hypothetical protein EMIHUDRAFT_369283 [Emiliania huxleyi CCMP1516]XP_005786986.1 hypothetical protein EMIHUDRAFT_363440 [Emiliania huxleyi CCMP1516]EOD20119.1 hypothetical protein EMIHUDRAFT_369283 [Emiliania huxleyi CCMP1516]EOD34557.1 hypothetical protein EMIHUDRAFT_363440 [Emiliania huxleyi CCMP1516]|eukprot:XP_005772548.1 hypothetical protein EMIHUDRAFT_369283 [Emiliania huxleyi CCMP1516]
MCLVFASLLRRSDTGADAAVALAPGPPVVACGRFRDSEEAEEGHEGPSSNQPAPELAVARGGSCDGCGGSRGGCGGGRVGECGGAAQRCLGREHLRQLSRDVQFLVEQPAHVQYSCSLAALRQCCPPPPPPQPVAWSVAPP